MRTLIETGHAVLPSGEVLEDAGILIDGQRIVAVESRRAFEGVDAVRRVTGRGSITFPGFVNAHQHGNPDSAAARGVPDQPLECWLVALIGLPARDAYDDALRTARRLVAGGITTAVHAHFAVTDNQADYEASLRAVLRGYSDAGVRVVLAAEVRDRGVPLYTDTEGYLRKLPAGLREQLGDVSGGRLDPAAALEVIDGVRASIRRGELGDVLLALGPPGPPWCSDDLYRRVAGCSQKWDMPVTTHLLESRYERLHGERDHPGGSVDRLRHLGLLNSRMIAAHCVWLDQREREAMATAGASIATNPSSNLRLHSGIAPVREFLEAGVNVALGTDNMALGGGEDILDELRLLVALHRRQDVADRGLSARAATAILTENGGRAVGREDIGVLAPGAMADLVVIDLDPLRPPDISAPPLDLALTVASSRDFSMVMTGGRIVWEEPRPPVPSTPDAVAAEARRDAAARLAELAREHVQGWEAG